MSDPRIIGLCGDIGSGKTTVAHHLAMEHGYQELMFSDKLKQVAVEVFGIDPRCVFGTQEDKAEAIPHVRDASGTPRTGRSILEWLGTEGFRTVDPQVWVNYLLRTMDGDTKQKFVVSDARFRNEFEAIRSRGGLVWEVVKVGGPDHGRTGHKSDQEWRSIQRDNTVMALHGDLKALHASVDIALAEGIMHPELRGA